MGYNRRSKGCSVRLIIGGRQSGRTTELINRAAESELKGEVCYIVCHNQREASRIADLAKEMGKTIGFPITYEELLSRHYAGRYIHHLYIDNADYLLSYIAHVPIDSIVVELNDEALKT